MAARSAAETSPQSMGNTAFACANGVPSGRDMGRAPRFAGDEHAGSSRPLRHPKTTNIVQQLHDHYLFLCIPSNRQTVFRAGAPGQWSSNALRPRRDNGVGAASTTRDSLLRWSRAQEHAFTQRTKRHRRLDHDARAWNPSPNLRNNARRWGADPDLTRRWNSHLPTA